MIVISNGPVLVTESGVTTPLSAESAAEPTAGSESRLNVATTSSAVSGVPSLNFTFCRIVKTQLLPLPSGVFQAVAISGLSVPAPGSTYTRYSPVMPVVESTACVRLVIGSTAMAGLSVPTRSVPPALAVAGVVVLAYAAAPPNMPSSGTDMPMPVPSLSSAARLRRPAMYSSM